MRVKKAKTYNLPGPAAAGDKKGKTEDPGAGTKTEKPGEKKKETKS